VRITYSHLRPMGVFHARATGPYALSTEAAWATLCRWLARHDARRRVLQAFGLFRDDPNTVAPELLRFDACIPVIDGLEPDPTAGILHQSLPAGAYAIQTHIGSYDQLGTKLSQLHREFVPQRGLTVDYDRPFLVRYLNDPMWTRAVHRRTELCIPVLPAPMAMPGNDDTHEHGPFPWSMERRA
jgi:AraC family transcriptional regulator